MKRAFFCVDGHTAGNPVRLVAAGAPHLNGATMSERRQDFLTRFDHIRRGLMFEPRGHDMMSGGFLYPPCSADADVAILFIETSGCLPMCGHGTIGLVTFGLEQGFITPRAPGQLIADTPAGRIEIDFEKRGDKVLWVRLRNVASYLAATAIPIDVPGLGALSVDVAYGGNYYAIVEPQAGYAGLDALGPAGVLALSPLVRQRVRAALEPVHPLDPTIRGVSHVMWTDAARAPGASGRAAVFYGERAIDRSPCGTGTSARMAQMAARGELSVGDSFIHESLIGSLFDGRVEAMSHVGDHAAIVPSIKGSAYMTGLNQIWIDDEEPFPEGFQVG